MAINPYEDILSKWFGLALILKMRSDEITGWMKENAPWKDRTGMARQSLRCVTDVSPKEIVLKFSHGVDYGVYLEHKNAGKYAILRPAIDFWKDAIKKDIDDVFRGAK